jgi:[ribosomal protein S5]-alanine N-acetyltransferase
MTLVAIQDDGLLPAVEGQWPDIAASVLAAYAKLYAAHGYIAPWTGYFALVGGVCVGTCGFKSPPSDGSVEIAYFTFPEYERRGHASEMARQLLELVRCHAPTMAVAAHTLPEENASTAILRRLGFQFIGEARDEEDGAVWAWRHGQDIA